MNVEAMLIAVALCPSDDMRGAQKFEIGHTGELACSIPVVQQRVSKDVLSHSLNYQALRFSRSRQFLCFFPKAFQRRIRKADAEPIDLVQSVVNISNCR